MKKPKKYLAWCDKHAFVVIKDLPPNVTMINTASCGCPFPRQIKRLSEAIKIVEGIRHANWHKTIKLGALHISFVGYKDHFWKLRNFRYKLKTIWTNLKYLTEEYK